MKAGCLAMTTIFALASTVDASAQEVLATHKAQVIDQAKRADIKNASKYLTEGLGLRSIGTQPSTKNEPNPSHSIVSGTYSRYAATPVEGGTCLVGAEGDEDGMNRRPHVELIDAEAGRLRWIKKPSIPVDHYEGRATHCLGVGNSLFVLLQIDTHSQRSLSQTVLHLVKLRATDGLIESDAEVSIPGAFGAYSAWVAEDATNLRKQGDEIVVVGKYRRVDADEEDVPFSVRLRM